MPIGEAPAMRLRLQQEGHVSVVVFVHLCSSSAGLGRFLVPSGSSRPQA